MKAEEARKEALKLKGFDENKYNELMDLIKANIINRVVRVDEILDLSIQDKLVEDGYILEITQNENEQFTLIKW